MYSINDKGLSAISISLFVLFHIVVSAAVSAQVLAGTTGASPQWGSGWLVLTSPVDFAKGERLKVSVGGSATKILVRLLPQGASPDKAIGLIAGVIDVPESRIVEITIPEDRKQVTQISVMGDLIPGVINWGEGMGLLPSNPPSE